MTSSPIPKACRQHRTLADRRFLHHQPGRQDRGRHGRRDGQPRAIIPGAANACPTPATARRRKRRWQRSRRCRRPSPAGSTGTRCRRRCPPAPPATRWIARCWTSRPSAGGQRIWTVLGPSRAAPLHHRLHDLAGDAGGDGDGDRQGRAPAAAQDQARRRRRWRADIGGAQGRPRIRTDRRCQRGLDAGQSRTEPRRLRRGRRDAGRAAAAGRTG